MRGSCPAGGGSTRVRGRNGRVRPDADASIHGRSGAGTRGAHREDGFVGRCQGAGQGGSPQGNTGRLHRADRRERHPEPLAPSAVQPALRHERRGRHPRLRLEAYEPEGLGGRQLVGQERREGAGAPVGRAVAADDERRLPHRHEGGDDPPGQLMLVRGQLVGHRAVTGTVAGAVAGDAQDRCTEGSGLGEHRLDGRGPHRHGQHPAAPGLGDPQSVLERGCVRGRPADPPGVAGDGPAERVDPRTQIGDRQAGHHQRAVIGRWGRAHPQWKTTPWPPSG